MLFHLAVVHGAIALSLGGYLLPTFSAKEVTFLCLSKLFPRVFFAATQAVVFFRHVASFVSQQK